MSTMPLPPNHPANMNRWSWLDIFRSRNILDDIGMGGNQTLPNQGVIYPGQSQQPSIDPYNPDARALEEFRGAIGGMPQREDYQPSVLRRIGAMISGFGKGGPIGMWGGVPVGWRGDADAATEFRDRPYNQALDEWRTRTGALGTAANMENDYNTQIRISENQRRADENANRRMDITEERNAQLARDSEARIQIEKGKLELRKFQIENPDYEWFEQPGGNVIGIHPRTGKTLDSGVPTNAMTDLDKAELNLKNAKALESQRQANRIALEGAQHDNTMTEIGARGDQARQTATVRGAEGLNPNEQAVALFNKAQEAYNRFPEWQDYIQLDVAGRRFNIRTPEGEPGFLWAKDKPGGDPEVAKKIVEYIYGPEGKPATTAAPAQGTNLREQAIKQLMEDGHPTTEANIQYVMKQLGAR